MGGAAPLGAAGAGALSGAPARSGPATPQVLAGSEEEIVHDEFDEDDDW